MSKISKSTRRMESTEDKPERTMGIDVGDRYSHLCLLAERASVTAGLAKDVDAVNQ